MRTSSRRSGFTLVELIVFAAIFAVAAIVFMSVLVAVTRVQVRQMSMSEVAQQSQYLLQTIQRSVESSRNIEMTTDQTVTMLRLRMEPSAADPTIIFVSGTVMYIQQSTSSPQPLSSGRVSVSNVAFTKRANPGGRDSVNIAFTVSFNTQNIQQQFVQALSTSIVRVNAATFDSDIHSSSSGSYSIGTTAREWLSINNTLNFGANSNVGIGGTPASSSVKLQVYGGNIAIDQSGAGIVFKNGANCYLLYMSSTAKFVTSSVTCP